MSCSLKYVAGYQIVIIIIIIVIVIIIIIVIVIIIIIIVIIIIITIIICLFYRNPQEWHDWVVKRGIPANEAVLYLGDINEDMYREPEKLQMIWDTLHATMAEPLYGELNYTSESLWNDVRINANPNGRPEWIDHVAYRWGKGIRMA